MKHHFFSHMIHLRLISHPHVKAAACGNVEKRDGWCSFGGIAAPRLLDSLFFTHSLLSTSPSITDCLPVSPFVCFAGAVCLHGTLTAFGSSQAAVPRFHLASSKSHTNTRLVISWDILFGGMNVITNIITAIRFFRNVD